MLVALSPHAYCYFSIIEQRFFYIWPRLKVGKGKKALEAASGEEMGISTCLCEAVNAVPGHGQ